MQNPHAKWRTDLARRLTECLATFRGVQAIVVAGSVARNYADEYSDVEMPLFWEALPDDATRHAIVAALKANFLHTYNGPAWEDQLLISGLQVDLWHIAVTDQEATLQAVLYDHCSDLGSLNALDTIRSCIPLYGDDIVQSWKHRAQEYPEELAKRILQEHLASFSVGELFILAQRDNPTAFYAQLSHLQQEMFLVLLALNRSYFPTFKWLYRSLESMPVKPEAVGQRFQQAFRTSPEAVIADTQQLLEETLHLVEMQFPQIDTALIQRRLTYVRAAHEKPMNR